MACAVRMSRLKILNSFPSGASMSFSRIAVPSWARVTATRGLKRNTHTHTGARSRARKYVSTPNLQGSCWVKLRAFLKVDITNAQKNTHIHQGELLSYVFPAVINYEPRLSLVPPTDLESMMNPSVSLWNERPARWTCQIEIAHQVQPAHLASVKVGQLNKKCQLESNIVWRCRAQLFAQESLFLFPSVG